MSNFYKNGKKKFKNAKNKKQKKITIKQIT